MNNSLGYSYYQQPTANYQQSYAPQNQQSNYQQQAPVIPPKVVDYVQGELAATIYPVAYNQEVFLLDMDDPNRVYRKSRDANGKITPLEKCRLVTEEDVKPSEVNLKDYVKVDDILDIVSEAVQTEVERRLSEISFKPTASDNKFLKKGDKS
jgi:hypothetical protein